MAERVEAVRCSQAFDADWYSATHADVALTGFDPAEHFERFGPLLRRPPRPGVSTGFYTDLLGRGPASGAAVLAAATVGLPEEVKAPAIMWAAARAALEDGDEVARITATAHLPPGMEHLLHILDVSAAARRGKTVAWLDALNSYLAAFDLAPLVLDEVAAKASGNLLAGLGTREIAASRQGPGVTVLMAAHNAEATIGYAVRSILAQTWSALELIVVDDASRDDTVRAAELAAAGDRRFRLLRSPVNAGPYACRNAALPLAAGEFVTCHDADDWAHPERIARQVAFVQEKGTGHGMAGWMRMTARGEVTRLARSGPNTRDGATTAAMVSTMLERRLLTGIYGHWDDVRFGADSEMIRRIEQVEARAIPRLTEPLLLGLDSPGSLTNHPLLGYNEQSGISPVRRVNRNSASVWHREEASHDPWLSFPHEPRRFSAHSASLNELGVVTRISAAFVSGKTEPEEMCDLLIVTNMRFPGGNCSSTLDEVRALCATGWTVRLVHCPLTLPPGRRTFEISERYDPVLSLVVPAYAIGHIRARRMIVRHPRVLTSPAFTRLSPRLTAEQADVVVNNAIHRPSGVPVYDPDALIGAARALQADTVRIVPLGPLIRRELTPLIPSDLLAAEDWPPTFDVASYALEPKERLAPPYRIGRHGRDGAEKWLSDPTKLLAAYPADRDFAVDILGGAGTPARLLGELPANWTVLPFGTVEPIDYLRTLDVFAYYPDEQLNEAFGRTVVEAMIAARPVLLPPRFRETFGDLAHYADPEEVAGMVRRLARDWDIERPRLLHVQAQAIARFSSAALAARFPEFALITKDGT